MNELEKLSGNYLEAIKETTQSTAEEINRPAVNAAGQTTASRTLEIRDIDPNSLQGMLQEVNQIMHSEQTMVSRISQQETQGLAPDLAVLEKSMAESLPTQQKVSALPKQQPFQVKSGTKPQSKSQSDKLRLRHSTIATKAKQTKAVDALKKKPVQTNTKGKSVKPKGKAGGVESRNSEVQKLNQSLSQSSDIRERLRALMGKVNSMTVETFEESANELEESDQSDNVTVPAMKLVPKKYSPEFQDKSLNVSSAIEHYETASDTPAQTVRDLQPQVLNFSSESSSQGQSLGGENFAAEGDAIHSDSKQ